MPNMVRKRIRCLQEGCNPEPAMYAEGEEGTPVRAWRGDAVFIKHALAFPKHRIAKWPERSAEGEAKQRVRSQTGVYPKNLGEELKAKALADAEWAAGKPERIRLAEEQRLAGIARRQAEAEENEARRQKSAVEKAARLQQEKKDRKALLARLGDWGMDQGFLKECVENPQLGIGLFNAIVSLEEYGADLRKQGGVRDGKIFDKLKADYINQGNWETATKRGSYQTDGMYTEEEMKERRAFIKQWEKLTAKGERQGWLDWTNEYAGSTLYGVTDRKHPTRKDTHPERANEYADRLKKKIQTVHGRIRNEFDSLERARRKLEQYG